MSEDISRRKAIKLAAAGAMVGMGAGMAKTPVGAGGKGAGAWAQTHDRVWLGGEYWANPMENWKVSDGAAQSTSRGENRSVHSLTHQLVNADQPFSMAVKIEAVDGRWKGGGAGFRVGVKSELNEVKSNCFARGGLNAGVKDGSLVLGKKTAEIPGGEDLKGVELRLDGEPEGGKMKLSLMAVSLKEGESLARLSVSVPGGEVLGNVALVSNYPSGGKPKKGKKAKEVAGTLYRFRGWSLGGEAFEESPEQRFGPILWSMYSMSDSRTEEGFVMKMSALTGPMGEKDSQTVELHVERGGKWEKIAEEALDTDAWVATFRIPKWNEKVATPYKLVYREKHRDGSETPDEWKGVVQANPVGRPLRMAALTCQNDYGFPYAPVSENVERLKPDLAYFSGDQIYESHGGFGIIREPAEEAILNYLRKYYQFGWAFRNVMHSQPTLCLPDDHDVFQGNIWGEGGAAMDVRNGGASSKGGYIEPARMVNAVHRTTVGHHPDAADPTPVKQDISVYYGDMVYGGVSFAIIADRQWKSGPERVETGSGRADHVKDPNFDCVALDKPGLVLLGERQEAFLKKWSSDWRGHTLKAVLSQTVFAGVATHHGREDGYLKADLDSGAWPQTARNRAIDLMRPSMALHINGDQHLTTLCQYGVKEQRDSNWSFCTPAISAGYPRWWLPDEVGMGHENRPEHGHANTGEFIDGFGNKVYVYAVGNPVKGVAPNRYDKAHEKGSGFGFVTFDTEKKTYLIESFKFLIDATDGKASNQYPGFPVTIHQAENRGENRLK